MLERMSKVNCAQLRHRYRRATSLKSCRKRTDGARSGQTSHHDDQEHNKSECVGDHHRLLQHVFVFSDKV